MSDETKLGRALQDAALTNINEDIQAICDNLEIIVEKIPNEAKKQVALLKEDISSLAFALKDVPEKFDIDFSRKINRILEVASEIESHTKQYKKSLVLDLEKVLYGCVIKINEELSNKISNNFIIKGASFYTAIIVSSLFGGLIGGACIATFIYFMTL